MTDIISKVTCGNCHRSWDEIKDPAPSAMCHFCHGRGHSDAEIKTLKNGATEIARIEINGKIVVMAKRDDSSYEPFATWRMDEEGNTYWGHYFKTHNEAVTDMLARA